MRIPVKVLSLAQALAMTIGMGAWAGEDVGNIVKDASAEAGNTATQLGRWGARQGRKVTGKDSAKKDQADRDANTMDNARVRAGKTKRQAQEDSN